MSLTLTLVLACFYNFSVGLSISCLFFKSGTTKTLLKSGALFVIINLVLVIAGVFSGSAIYGLTDNLSLQAGSALLMVVALKMIIRGWKTKPLNRIYDISRTQTMIWFFIALNIDTLLFCIAIPLISGIGSIIIIPAMVASSILGITTGVNIRKQSSLLLPNIIELITGIAVLILGAVNFIL